jgi:copper oxidase (laccase) domain-containing protein
VGSEVRDAFLTSDIAAESCFIPSLNSGKYMADIYALARLRLNKLGITQITGGSCCTYTEENKFFSYRRDTTTGRMATLIWLSS